MLTDDEKQYLVSLKKQGVDNKQLAGYLDMYRRKTKQSISSTGPFATNTTSTVPSYNNPNSMANIANKDEFQNPLTNIVPDLVNIGVGVPTGIFQTGKGLIEDVGGAVKSIKDIINGKYQQTPEYNTIKLLKSIVQSYKDKYVGQEPNPTGNFATDVFNTIKSTATRTAKTFTQQPISTLLDASMVTGGAGVAAKIAGMSKTANALNIVSKVTNPIGLVSEGVGLGGRAIAENTIIDKDAFNAIKKTATEAGMKELPFGEIKNIIKTTDNKTLLLKTLGDQLDRLNKISKGDMPPSKMAETAQSYLQQAQETMDKLEKAYYQDAYKETQIAGGTTGSQGGMPKMKSATEVKITLPATIQKIDEMLADEKAKGTASVNKKAVDFLKKFKKDISKNMTYDNSQFIQNALSKIDWVDADAAELTNYKRALWGRMKQERIDQLDKLAPGFKTRLQAADAIFKAHADITIKNITDNFGKYTREKDFEGAMQQIVDPTMSPELTAMVKNRLGGKTDMAKAYIINDIANKSMVDGVVNYNKIRNGINKWKNVSDQYFSPAELQKIENLESTAKSLQKYKNTPEGNYIFKSMMIWAVGDNKFISTPMGKSFLEQASHNIKYIRPLMEEKEVTE
jgi:hypothetical protein